MNELALANRAADWRRLKALVLDRVSSPITKRVYNLGLNEFFAWYALEPRPGFTKATVSAWRVALEARGLGSVSLTVRITAVRTLAVEAADSGLLAPELAAGIARVKGAKSIGVRTGNWLSVQQAQKLLNAPDVTTKKGLRDRAMLAILLGCGLRRSEVAALTLQHIQQRDNRWCIVDLVGKHGRVRTIPMPTWVKVAIDTWTGPAGITRTGIIAGFARSTPHDGYFFDHPDEVIAGAIPPPRFNLANLAAVARHVGSLVLEQAQLDYPSNLASFLAENGNTIEASVNDLIARIRAAVPGTMQRAAEIFRDVEGVNADWLQNVTESFPAGVRSAIEQRGALIAEAARHMSELGRRVGLNRAEEGAESSYRNLARKLRSDYKYAYLPTVLAEAGLLPGYAFPGDPGSLSLALDPDVVFAGRLQAQREFCPGQIVYARGHRWSVKGLALHRPGASGTGRGPERFAFTECPSCKLAQASGNNCRRCNGELAGADQTALDAAAFQSWPEEVEPESEEERSQGVYDVRPHPQRDVACTAWTLGEWRLELRRQESIWWINHGPFSADNDGDGVAVNGPAQGFRLCPTCGELVRPLPQPQAPRRGRRPARDPRAALDPHAQRCNGQPQVFTLGHQMRGDTLRLVVNGLQELGDEGVAWAWSVGTALLEGARKRFELDDDDLDVIVQTVRDDHGATRALEILWVDMVTGGSGIFDALVRDFPRVAQEAVRHLDGHDCPTDPIAADPRNHTNNPMAPRRQPDPLVPNCPNCDPIPR